MTGLFNHRNPSHSKTTSPHNHQSDKCSENLTMSAFTGRQPDWLEHEESRYADDFVEEEDSFLILPSRRDEVGNVEAELASAGHESGSGDSIKSVKSAPSTSHLPQEKYSSTSSQVGTSSASGENPVPLPRNSLPSRANGNQMTISGTDGFETPSLISAVSSVSSSEHSFDETNMLMSQSHLNLQSCKEKMAEMTASATKNLEAYKELQESVATLRAEHQKKYDECGTTIRTLRAENQTLRDELSQARTTIQEHEVQNEIYSIEINKLEQQLSANEMDITSARKQLEEQVKRLQESNRQNKELMESIRHLEIQTQQGKQNDLSSLQEERNVLYEAWEASKITVAQLKETLLKQEETVKQLEKELKESRLANEKLKDCGSKKDGNVETLKAALEEAGKTLRQFQGIIAEKDNEISNLQMRMAALNSENEQMEVWKHQVEGYKADFESEREDRMAMRDRNEVLKEELAKMNVLLESKTAELEALHQTHLQLANEHVNRNEDANVMRGNAPPSEEFVFVSPQPHTSDTGTSGDSTQQTPSIPPLGPQSPQPCPLCNRKFTSVGSLERHAANCGIEAAATRTDPFVFP